MAGKGHLVSECNDSIMQLERLRALKAVKEAKQSGIWTNRLEDKSREWRVLANGARLVAEMEVRPLSARLRCFKNLHFEDGKIPIDNKLEELPRGLFQLSDILEAELPDPDLLTLYEPLRWPWADPVRELVGRTGELLLGLALPGDLAPSDPDRIRWVLRESMSSVM